MRTTIGVTIFVAVFSLQTAAASAEPILFNNRTAFEEQGTIAFRTNFDDFGPGWTDVYSDGFHAGSLTRGDVTYSSIGGGFTAGADTVYAANQEHTLLFPLDYARLRASIAEGPQYQMFGFDVGMAGPGTVSLIVSTNLGSYSYDNLLLARTDKGELEFWGFVSRTEGEFFTGLNLYGLYDPATEEPSYLGGVHPLPGVTNVVVGQVNAPVVPEPTSISLLALGLAGLVGRSYRARLPRRVNRV